MGKRLGYGAYRSAVCPKCGGVARRSERVFRIALLVLSLTGAVVIPMLKSDESPQWLNNLPIIVGQVLIASFLGSFVVVGFYDQYDRTRSYRCGACDEVFHLTAPALTFGQKAFVWFLGTSLAVLAILLLALTIVFFNK